MIAFLSLLNILAVILFSYIFFKKRRKRVVLFFSSLITSLFLLTLIQAIGLDARLSLVIMEYCPILVWTFFAVISIDASRLTKKWSYLTYILIFGLAAGGLIISLFKADILSDFYRTGYSSPLLAVAVIFLLLRAVQYREARSTFLLFAIFSTYIVTNPLTGAAISSYFAVTMLCFLLISLVFGVIGTLDIVKNKKKINLIFGKGSPRKQTINRRSFIFMFGSFLIIFILSLLLLTTLVRLLVLKRVEKNLIFQNEVIERSIDAFNSRYSSYLEVVAEGGTQPNSFLGREAIVGVEQGDDNYGMTGNGDDFSLVHRYSYEENLVEIYTKKYTNDYYFKFIDNDNSKISIFVSGGEIFENVKNAGALAQSDRISLINVNSKEILQPLNKALIYDIPLNESVSLNCHQILRECSDGNCAARNINFIEVNGIYKDEQIINATNPLPSINACLSSDIKEREVFINPNPREATAFFISGASLAVIFLIASILFSKSISESISKMHRMVQSMKKGDYSKKIMISSNDEIDELADVFNDLILKLRDSEKNIQKKVTERTKELKSERNKLQIIIKEMNDGFVFINSEGEVELFNNTAYSITGIQPKDIIGKNERVFKILDEKKPEKEIDIFKEIVENKKVELSGNGLVLNKSKQFTPILFSATPIGAGSLFLGIAILFKDISKEREIDKMKSNFVSIVSHQFRTPLTAIKWTIEMLLNGDEGKLNEKQKGLLEDIFKSNKRLVKLVSELLRVSHLESGKIKAEPKKSKIIPVLKKVVKDQERSAKQHKIKINLDLPKKEVEAYVDPVMYEGVVENFLTNAIDYTPNKSNAKIDVKVEITRDAVVTSIKDYGVGISEDDQKRVFSMFYRSDNALKLRADGTGLGLFIAKMMAEMSGGKIWFESELDEGSTFYVSFPRKRMLPPGKKKK